MKHIIALLIGVPWGVLLCLVSEIRGTGAIAVVGFLVCLISSLFVDFVWPTPRVSLAFPLEKTMNEQKSISAGERSAPPACSEIVRIDGNDYVVIDCDDLKFTNMCNFCAFKGTECYSRRDFSCHSDSRKDGKDVVFQLIPNAPGQTSAARIGGNDGPR